ncbi:MAG: outer membrane protein assembly factor BamE [Candidatus Dactylopiibacterium sp.]|nr:outer membrane protein assembly factor BamE [Candidatus Dactylopiibacterium sp.]
MTSVVRPYRIDVRQGNAITQEMVSHLSPGMTKEQVRFVMGSPMLVSVFHADRWDYVYQFSKGYEPIEQRRLTLFFSGDRLERVEGDVVAATGNEAPAQQAPKVIDISGPGAPARKP